MARGRDIKPGFFDNEELATVSRDARLLFIALWTMADREGRLEDRPARIKVHSFPYDSDITAERIDQMLGELARAPGRPIIRYEVDGARCVCVSNFKKHQHIHPNEKPSELPTPPSLPVITGSALVTLPEESGKATERAGNSALPSEPSSLPGSLSGLSASDPDQTRAGSNGDANLPTASQWQSYFSARHREKTGRWYGQGEADAKAIARLADLFDGAPPDQLRADWDARERIVGEFLASADPKTVEADWSFSFFVARFRGLALPPEKRPKPPQPARAAGNGQRPVVWRSE